jgi:hypothetical protein
MGAIWGLISTAREQSVAFWGSGASILVLLLLIYFEWVRPRLRERKLKRPVKAHFTIRRSENNDEEPHHVRRLVLPSNQALEVEVGLHPKINFHASEVIFGCKGDANARPTVTGRARQFVKSGNLPDPSYYIDHADWCHARIDRDYNKGTHHVMGFAVHTREAGLYKVVLSFVTSEIEGNYDRLEILVEDDPHTIMCCHAKEHDRNCRIDPATLPQPPKRQSRAAQSRRKQ